jgi:hypothetical protein
VKKRVVWTKTPGDHEAKEKTERGGGIGVAVHYNCSAQSEPTTVPEVIQMLMGSEANFFKATGQ